MTKKWKIFGYQTNIEWYDIKTKFKQLLRKITYSWLFQEIICSIFASYMWFVYLTSKKQFINDDLLIKSAKENKPLLIVFWHNRLMMIPFITKKPKKLFPKYTIMTLASNHGDGKFVGRVMEKFGLKSILGSTKDGRKSSRGISTSTLRQIIKGLRKGDSIGITPDGPRGPNQKINGEILNIAKISGAGILPCSYSTSKMLELKTWDKFKIPLPFSKLCFYFDEKIFFVDENISNSVIEERLNIVQEKSRKKVN